MSTIDKLDKAIDRLIDRLVYEFTDLSTSSERKHQIVEEVALLRASLSPQCVCPK